MRILGVEFEKEKIVLFLRKCGPLLLVTVLAAALRFYRLGRYGLWYDEILSTLRARWGLHYFLFKRFRLTDFFIFLELLVGNSEFIIRFYAAFFGVLGVAATYIFANKFFGKRVAFLSSIFLAFNPFHIYYSQDARYYAVVFFFSLLSYYLLLQFLENSRVQTFLLLLVVNLLGIFTHPSFFILIGSEVLFIIFLAVFWFFRGEPLHKILFEKLFNAEKAFGFFEEQKPIFRTVIVFGVTFLFLVIVHQGYRVISAKIDFSFFSSERPELPSRFSSFWRFYWDLFKLFSGVASEKIRFGLASFFAMGFGFALLKKRWRLSAFSLVMFICPILFIWLFRPHHRFAYRYVMFLEPLWILYITLGFVSVMDLLFSFIPHTIRNKSTVVLGVTLAVSLLFYQRKHNNVTIGTGHYAWREMARFIHDNSEEGDIVYGRFLEGNVAVPYYLSRTVGISLEELIEKDVIIKSISFGPVPEGELYVGPYRILFRTEVLKEVLSDFTGTLWSAGPRVNHPRTYLYEVHKFPEDPRTFLFEYKVTDLDFSYSLDATALYEGADNLVNIRLGEEDRFVYPGNFDKKGRLVHEFNLPGQVERCYLRIDPYVLYEGNYFEIWYSVDGIDYELAQTVQAAGEHPVVGDLSVDLSSALSGADTVYIRLDLFTNSETSVVTFDTRIRSLDLAGAVK